MRSTRRTNSGATPNTIYLLQFCPVAPHAEWKSLLAHFSVCPKLFASNGSGDVWISIRRGNSCVEETAHESPSHTPKTKGRWHGWPFTSTRHGWPSPAFHWIGLVPRLCPPNTHLLLSLVRALGTLSKGITITTDATPQGRASVDNTFRHRDVTYHFVIIPDFSKLLQRIAQFQTFHQHHR